MEVETEYMIREDIASEDIVPVGIIPNEIVQNILKQVVPLKTYSVINKYYNRFFVIDFINKASLEFDLRTVSIYEENLSLGQTIKSMIFFNVSTKDIDDDRYTQGIVRVTIRKDNDGCNVTEVSLKLYYHHNNEWEDLDVDDNMVDYIRMNHVQSITETFNIAEELLYQCISIYTIDSVIRISYDRDTSVGILYGSAISRSGGCYPEELLALAKSRVENDPIILKYHKR
jgi:hypothetical protein